MTACPVVAQAQFWSWGGYEERRYDSDARERRDRERAQRQRRQERELGKAGKREIGLLARGELSKEHRESLVPLLAGNQNAIELLADLMKGGREAT